MLGFTNLLPGPNSIEMVMHPGILRAGYRVWLTAGFCDVMPGEFTMLGLAVNFGRWESIGLGL